jgi:hypothetical protein
MSAPTFEQGPELDLGSLPLLEAQALRDAAERARHGHFTYLTLGGKRLAAIVPPELGDAEMLRALLPDPTEGGPK